MLYYVLCYEIFEKAVSKKTSLKQQMKHNPPWQAESPKCTG